MDRPDVTQFVYRPPLPVRLAERFFPQWANANRRAALASHLFDSASRTSGFQRAIHQFTSAYDILGGDRTRKGLVKSLTGTGDSHLTESALSDLREVARDASRNDPVVKGLLATYAEGIVGSELKIEARSSDEKWNEAREQLWSETMLDRPCDITGRLSFTQAVFLAVLSFARDGDCFVVFRDDGVWLVEGEQVGTPSKVNVSGETFNVVNGVAVEKTTGQVIGYYIGKPDVWGYIQSGSYTRLTADQVHHVFDPDRVSYTRGEPLLTPSVQWFDKFARYADAELVTSCVQACQGIAITHKCPESMIPVGVSHKANSEVNAEDSLKRFQMAPGMVWDLDPDDGVQPIGSTRPTTVFGEFMQKVLMIAGRSTGMPLMLLTQDLSGATFMNARIALLMAQERWKKVQAFVVKPLVSRWYLWQTQRDLSRPELKPIPKDWRRHEVFCRRWPYVDPQKEATADQMDLANGTTSKTFICARTGRDYRDVVRERVRERQIEEQEGLAVGVTEGGDDPADSQDQGGGEAD